MQKSRKYFWFWLILYVALALADGLLTYIGTPDLALEGNPLVMILGLGWGALISVNVLVLIVVTAMLYYSLVKYRHPYIPYKDYQRYASTLHTGTPDEFGATFCKFPLKWNATFACFGFALVASLCASRVFLVLEWALYLLGSPIMNHLHYAFRAMPRIYGLSRPDIWISYIVLFITLIGWHLNKYQKNKKLVEDDPDNVAEPPKRNLFYYPVSFLSVIWRTFLICIFQNILLISFVVKCFKYLFRKLRSKSAPPPEDVVQEE